MDYVKALFSVKGLVIVVYILIGVFVNTASPHLPHAAFNLAALHSWVQYFISIFFWPLSFWHPVFTVGKWPAGSAGKPPRRSAAWLSRRAARRCRAAGSPRR